MHKIKSSVYQVKWVAGGREFTTNIPKFPWDNVKTIKAQIKKAAPNHVQILSIRQTKAMITNPLIK